MEKTVTCYFFPSTIKIELTDMHVAPHFVRDLLKHSNYLPMAYSRVLYSFDIKTLNAIAKNMFRDLGCVEKLPRS